MTPSPHEFFIVVDVEAAGPNPRDYALLSIGACTLDDPKHTFYIELQPDSEKFTEEAMGVHGLTFAHLNENGLEPKAALAEFEAWIKQVTPKDAKPVFTAFNAPFDWMFVSDYFHRFLGRNPFGHKALDIKAYYMGQNGTDWKATSRSQLPPELGGGTELSHHALEDAIEEADLFQQLLDQNRTRSEPDGE